MSFDPTPPSGSQPGRVDPLAHAVPDAFPQPGSGELLPLQSLPYRYPSAAQGPHYKSPHATDAAYQGAAAAGPSHARGPRTSRQPKRKGKGKQSQVRSEDEDKYTHKNKRHRGNKKNGAGSGDAGDDCDPDRPEDLGEYEGGDAEPRQWFACPFYKLDPIRHSRCGGKYRLKTFKDVKGHMKRCHLLKDQYYCPRCWASFKTPEEWRAHEERGACQESVSPKSDYLRKGEEKLLETSSKLDDEGRWYELWENIFKEHNRPDSPYVESGHDEGKKTILQGLQPCLGLELLCLFQAHNNPATPAFLQVLEDYFRERIRSMPPPAPRYRGLLSQRLGEVAATAYTQGPDFRIAAHTQSHHDILSAQFSTPPNPNAGSVAPQSGFDHFHPGTGTSQPNALDPESLISPLDLIGFQVPAFYSDTQPNPYNSTGLIDSQPVGSDDALVLSPEFNSGAGDYLLPSIADEVTDQEIIDFSRTSQAAASRLRRTRR